MLGSILGGIFGARSASKQRKMLENEKKIKKKTVICYGLLKCKAFL